MVAVPCLVVLLSTAMIGCAVDSSKQKQRELDAALIQAANWSQYHKVRELLYRGARYDTKSQDRLQRGLRIAVIGHDVEMVRVVVDWGADPKHKTHRNTTWLFEATQQGQPDVIRFLYEQGVRDDLDALIDEAKSWQNEEAIELLKELKATEAP